MNPLFTPSASPGPRLAATPAKRPRLLPTLSDADFNAARRESSKRVLDVWSSLAARYSRALDDDDIINIATGKVIKDRGVLRSSSMMKFGFIVNPEDDEEDTRKRNRITREASTPSSDGVVPADEEDDELDAFAPSATFDAEIGRVKKVLVPPPTPNPEDEEDLRRFLEADKIINAEVEDSIRQEEDDCDDDLEFLTGPDLSTKDDEDSEDSDDQGLTDAVPSGWESSDREEEPLSLASERSSPFSLPLHSDEDSEDELAGWEIGSSRATPPPLTSSPSAPSRTSSPPTRSSSDDSDVEIIGFSIKPKHLPPLRRPLLSLPSPPRSSSTGFNAAPSTPKRTSTPLLSKSTVKPKSKAISRDMPPPQQLQTPPRSSVSVNESTPEVSAGRSVPRPTPKTMYRGAGLPSPMKKAHRSPSPSSSYFDDDLPRFPSPLPSLFPEPPLDSSSPSNQAPHHNRNPLPPAQSNPQPFSAIPKFLKITAPSSSNAAGPSRQPRGTIKPPEVVITTSARAFSRIRTPAPRFTAQEKGKGREITPPLPQTPPPSSPLPKGSTLRRSLSPRTPSPSRSSKAKLPQTARLVAKRKRKPSSSSDDSPLPSPSEPPSRTDVKSNNTGKRAQPKVVSTPRGKNDSSQTSDSDSDLNIVPTFPTRPRSRSRGASRHPTYPFPSNPYHHSLAQSEAANSPTYQPPYGQPMQDPRAQFIISAAMHQLSSLVSGGGGAYPAPYHHTPPPPPLHHYPHPPAPPLHSPTWPSYLGNPDPLPYHQGIAPYGNGKTLGQSMLRRYSPSCSPPPSSRPRPRAKSLVKRGQSRGRRVSFKSPSNEGRSRGKEKSDSSPIRRGSRAKSGANAKRGERDEDSGEVEEGSQRSSPVRGRMSRRSLERAQTPAPPLRSKSGGKGR